MLKKLIKSSVANLVSTLIPAFLAIPVMGSFARDLNQNEFNYVMLLLGYLTFLQLLDFGFSKRRCQHQC